MYRICRFSIVKKQNVWIKLKLTFLSRQLFFVCFCVWWIYCERWRRWLFCPNFDSSSTFYPVIAHLICLTSDLTNVRIVFKLIIGKIISSHVKFLPHFPPFYQSWSHLIWHLYSWGCSCQLCYSMLNKYNAVIIYHFQWATWLLPLKEKCIYEITCKEILK